VHSRSVDQTSGIVYCDPFHHIHRAFLPSTRLIFFSSRCVLSSSSDVLRIFSQVALSVEEHFEVSNALIVGKLSSEDMAETEGLRDVAKTTNFGTTLAANGL